MSSFSLFHMGLYSRLSLLALVILLLAGCMIPSGYKGDEIWQGRVVIEGNRVIPAGHRVRILPGTTLFFAPVTEETEYRDHPYFPGSELIVEGTLVAEGTPGAPILFAPLNGEDGAGSWGGVNIHGGEASFRYVHFAGADSAVHAANSRVRIEQCRFEKNLVGVRFNSSEIRLVSSTFKGNDTAIRFHFGSPEIASNLFSQNRKNIFITDTPLDYLITGNRFGVPLEYQVVLSESITDDVDLTRNYWEGCGEPLFPSLFYDHGVDPYLGTVLTGRCGDASAEDTGAGW